MAVADFDIKFATAIKILEEGDNAGTPAIII